MSSSEYRTASLALIAKLEDPSPSHLVCTRRGMRYVPDCQWTVHGWLKAEPAHQLPQQGHSNASSDSPPINGPHTLHPLPLYLFMRATNTFTPAHQDDICELHLSLRFQTPSFSHANSSSFQPRAQLVCNRLYQTRLLYLRKTNFASDSAQVRQFSFNSLLLNLQTSRSRSTNAAFCSRKLRRIQTS